MRSYTKITKGFSLVELVLAMALFSALVLAMSGGFAYAIQSTQIMAVKNKAVFIADEGLEAARSIRNEAFTNLTNGTFGLAQTGNKWVLSGASDVIGTYTRSLTITSLDSTTKQVVSTVSWTNPFASSVSYTLYLTDWRRVVSPAWSSPSLASTLNLTNTLRATKVAVSGNYAFVVRDSGTPNFVVVDISNSAAPSQVFSSTIAGNLSDIFISGNFAYITSDDKNSEFIIMSISPPTAPTITATLDMTGNTGALSVFVSGTKAYVGRAKSTPNPEFSIIDVSNPLVTPTVIGTVNMANSANSIYVSGTNVFIATSNTAQELTVINASNPAAPVQSGFLNLAAATTCSAVNGFGTTLFLGCANSSLSAINITTPATPTLTGTFATGAAVNDIIFNPANTLAFIGTSSATLEFQAIDISVLTAMSLRGSLNTVNTINGLAYDTVRDKIIAVTSNTSGELIIIQ